MSDHEILNVFDLSDLRTPWALFVVATLRIADHIAAGNNTIEVLAEKAQCDRDVLHAVLGHLVSKGVFGEPRSGNFTLNDTARQLLDPITRASLDLEDIGGRFAGAWGTLLDFTRTGKSAYAQLFGSSFWDDLETHPRLAATFDDLIGPKGHGLPDPQFDLVEGWDMVHTIVDVGGGTGAMLAAILRLRPGVKGILVDLPRTVARSTEIFSAAGVLDRVTTFGQSFFDPLPPGADLYMLRGVINDWPDYEAVEILKNCNLAAGPAGRVVVLKSVRPDGTPKDLTIEMVLVGGKHRSLSEFEILASKAGLKVVDAREQKAGTYIVECQVT